MSLKKIYSCNMCVSEKPKSELVGLYFKNLTEFELTEPEKTDGQHICKSCLSQLTPTSEPTKEALNAV